RSRSWLKRHGDGPARSFQGGRADMRLVIEQRFVHRSELFDTEVPVSNALAALSVCRGTRGQGQHGALRGAIVEVADFRERRARGREQTAVEGRHAEVAGPASRMREPVDGSKRVPQPRYPLL